MGKDYHKGKKIACYIPNELCEKIDKYIHNTNRFYNDGKFKITRTDVIKIALTEFLKRHDINS